MIERSPRQRFRMCLRVTVRLMATMCFSVTLTGPVLAQSGSDAARAQRGLTFARVHCAHCHSIDKVTDSPLRIAPPFRDLHKRYPVETLEEAFAEGIVTGHPSMPEFRLDPAHIGDLIAFMKTLE